MANIDRSPTAPAALAVFVPPQRRAPPRRPARTPIVIDVHPAFPAPSPRPSFARTLVRPQAKKSIRGYLLAAVLILTALVAVIAFRTPLVTAVPQLNGFFTAIGMPVNLLGIETRNVTASRFWSGGWELLRVEGVVVNVRSEPLAVPALQLTILDANGAVMAQWQQIVTEDPLAPGSILPFTTDFPEPPAGAATISIRFADGTTTAIATPPAISPTVRFGSGQVQTTGAAAAVNTTVRFGNATIQTIGAP